MSSNNVKIKFTLFALRKKKDKYMQYKRKKIKNQNASKKKEWEMNNKR